MLSAINVQKRQHIEALREECSDPKRGGSWLRCYVAIIARDGPATASAKAMKKSETLGDTPRHGRGRKPSVEMCYHPDAASLEGAGVVIVSSMPHIFENTETNPPSR